MAHGSGGGYDKSDIANQVAVALGSKRPLDYNTRSQRRGVENGLVNTFNGIKQRVAQFGNIPTNQYGKVNVQDVVTTDIAISIALGEKPRVDIVAVKEELKKRERQYKTQQDRPTSGKRGSAGEKAKALSLLYEKIKPLKVLIGNYMSGTVLFDLSNNTEIKRINQNKIDKENKLAEEKRIKEEKERLLEIERNNEIIRIEQELIEKEAERIETQLLEAKKQETLRVSMLEEPAIKGGLLAIPLVLGAGLLFYILKR